MVLFFGVLLAIALWAMLLAWVAKVAQSRGRSTVGWALGAGAAGVLGVAAGLQLVGEAVHADVSTAATLAFALAPLLLMAGPMVAIGVVLQREPVVVSGRKKWPVHFIGRGPGRVTIETDRVVFTWQDGSREVALAELQRVEPDGECVRVQCADAELAILPMGSPDTPEGRRMQSLQIARRLQRGPR